MSQSIPLASVIKKYDQNSYNLRRNVQHDRSLHISTLANAYMEAASSGASDNFLTMIEEMITNRDKYNSRKDMLDASEWEAMDKRTQSLMGVNVGVLSDGASALADPNAERWLIHAARLLNAFIWNCFRKLHHDRHVHKKELENLLREAKGNTSEEYIDMLRNMLRDRIKYDSRKDKLDAWLWQRQEKLVRDSLAPHTAVSILKCGAHKSADLTGGPVDVIPSEGPSLGSALGSDLGGASSSALGSDLGGASSSALGSDLGGDPFQGGEIKFQSASGSDSDGASDSNSNSDFTWQSALGSALGSDHSVQSDSDGASDSNSNTDFTWQSALGSDSDGDHSVQSDSDGDHSVQSDSDGDSDSDPDSDPDSDSSVKSSDSYFIEQSSGSGSGSDSESDTGSDSESDTGSDSESDTGSDSESDTDNDTDSEDFEDAFQGGEIKFQSEAAADLWNMMHNTLR